jgi:exosortase
MWSGDKIEWFWIGSHCEHEALLRRRQMVPTRHRSLPVWIASGRAAGVDWVLMDAIDSRVLAPPPAVARPSFWSEFQDYWVRVPDKWIFLTMLAGWCVLFQFVGISSFNFGTTEPSLFAWLYNAWETPAMDCGHGILIPFLVAILFWVKRRELADSLAEVWWPGLSLVGLALLIHVVGFLAQQPRVSLIGLFLGAYALIGVVWGWRTMWLSSFPMVLFAFCMPLGNNAEVVTLPLRMVSVTVTRMICHGVLDIDVAQRGTSLLDAKGKYEFDVVAACSGIRGLVASMVVASVFAMLSLRSIWKRSLMLFSTVPLAVCGNVVRLTVVVLVGEAYGQASAKWVHDWFGYVTYLFVNIGSLLVLAHWLREKPSPKSA